MTDTFSYNLSGRVALVTGASSGIGERFAQLLGAAGARVVLAARRTDRLEAGVERIRQAGGEAIAVAMDAASEESTIAAYDAAEAAFGTVDTIIANAGMGQSQSTLKLPVETFDDIIAVNLRGPFLTAREGARRMIAAGSAEKENGRIVITSSMTAVAAEIGLSAYAASKAGVAQLGRVMAHEWLHRGINVNSLCPGYLRTEINADWFDTEGGKKQIAGFNRRRLMGEDSLDAMLLFLCSDASRFVTGTSFLLDDGQAL
jgi:NAD(P)-dependent dehydrogenase (short-subunit alcohol dehydrogenase family)